MGKKILYITTKLPYPVIGGDKLRIYNNLKQLKLLGYDITLVSLVTGDDDLNGALEHNEFYTKLIPVKFNKKLAYINAVKALFNDKPFIVEYYYSKSMQKVVDKLIKEQDFDIISGYMIRIAPYLEKHNDQNIIIDIVDAVSMMYKRRYKTVESLYDKFKIYIEYLKVRKYEKKCGKLFKKNVVISDYDKQYLLENGNKATINIIENGIDTGYFSPIESPKENNICFVGSMQYIPNSEAAKYFATEIFPKIKKEIPDAKFKIIGVNPRKDLIDAVKNIEGILVTGKVDDVREYMKDCKVSVCPVKIAGGIQNKILEAMSMGIPVVTTPEGAEGVNATEEILAVAKTDKEYIQKCIKIMQNDGLRNEISQKSREFIVNNFSWDNVGNKWNKLIREIVY